MYRNFKCIDVSYVDLISTCWSHGISQDDTRDIYLFINSSTRWVIPGIAIYDAMQFILPDMHTICIGF